MPSDLQRMIWWGTFLGWPDLKQFAPMWVPTIFSSQRPFKILRTRRGTSVLSAWQSGMILCHQIPSQTMLSTMKNGLCQLLTMWNLGNQILFLTLNAPFLTLLIWPQRACLSSVGIERWIHPIISLWSRRPRSLTRTTKTLTRTDLHPFSNQVLQATKKVIEEICRASSSMLVLWWEINLAIWVKKIMKIIWSGLQIGQICWRSVWRYSTL